MSIAWTPEKIAELRKLNAGDIDYSSIAVVLGVSKSAIAGKLRRLGLASPAIRMTPEERLRRQRESKRKYRQNNKPIDFNRKRAAAESGPDPGYVPIADASDVVPLHINLMELTPKTCRWPYGDGPFTFCGCEKIDDGPYCYAHHLQATERPGMRRAAA
jgi:GcrA cell cycle regulator